MYVGAVWRILEPMNSGDPWRLGHRPALDGLRGIAILLVLIGHGASSVFWSAAQAGVSVFFALSGFLITTLLLERRDRTGVAGLGAFYRRRARRLLPAVAVFLAVIGLGSVWWPWLASPQSLFASAFYLQNVQVAGHPSDALAHLWSLSIEEQFYLLWPVVLMVAARRSTRGALVAAGLIFMVSLSWRLWMFGHGWDRLHIYYGSDAVACLLAAGCLSAFAARAGWSLPRSWFWPSLVAVGVAGVVVSNSVVTLALVPPFAACMGVLAVLACVAERGPVTPGWLNLVGRRSYALYLWHYPLVVVIPAHLDAPRLLTVPIGLALAWGITCASWRLVEKPAVGWSRTGGRRVDLLVPAETT